MSSTLVAALLLSAQPWTFTSLPMTLTTGETITRKPLPATMPGGLAILDFDNDGLQDIFFPNGGALPAGPKAPNKLFRNLGKMRFAEAGTIGHDYAFGTAVADYDRDGRLDILIAGLHGVTLHRNLGNGGFVDVTAKAGLAQHRGWSVAATWFDKDNDGDLDLFIVRYVDWDATKERQCIVDGKPDFCHPKHYLPTTNALFENKGDGTFTDVSVATGITDHKGKGMSVATADFDGDGFTDLFVSNDRVFNQLFLNRNGGKRFEEVAFAWGIAVPNEGNPPSAMGVDAQDFNGDGKPDLVYSALRDETFPIYRNTGTEFVEATASTRLNVLTRLMAGWGILFADLDNDGHPDIVAARSDALSSTGGKADEAKEPPSWFRNRGDGKFENGSGWDAMPRAMWRGAAAADLDNDGCLDVVLTALQQSPHILRNPCESKNNWLEVDVREPGTRIRVGESQWRVVSTATGYTSSNAGPQHFGLGRRTEVDVEIHWPGGRSKRLEKVKANQRIRP